MPAKVSKLDLSRVTGVLVLALPSATPLDLSDPVYQKVTAETDLYSITPRIFSERVLLENCAECPRFVDTYTNGTQSVLRFGIDPSVLGTLAEISRINYSPKKLAEVKSSITGSGKGATTTAATTIDPRAAEIQTQQTDAQGQLTKYEREAVNDAIAYLRTGQRTALIDVLERDANGTIKASVHTAVLFEQGGKYLVIDPSNASFSHILAGSSDDIRLCHSKKFQVYSKPQDAATGPSVVEWRDCIDVAVKLAFNIELNTRLGILQQIVVKDYSEPKTVGEIDFVSLRDSVPVKEVTNQKDVYKKLPDEVCTHPMRLKQSSDVKVEKKVTAALKILDKTLTDLRKTVEVLDLYHAFSALEQKIKDFYRASDAATQYNDFERECKSFLKNIDHTVGSSEATALLGLEFNAIDQLP